MRVLASIALVVLLAGCKASGCGSSSSTSDPPDASSPVVVASANADAAAADPLVNLLYTTPAVVAVSSKVDNPKDFPEHVIDGKPETAWNGKTGDLVGGWIAFRVPADAHVMAIAMSAGFDKRAKNGDDLFSQNHRIARVRISRDGAVLREFSFNLGKRTPQSVPIDAAGGDFKIEVLEVAPGTKVEWRELVVSELAVWGVRGATRLDETHLPVVRVGSLDVVDAGARAPAPASLRGPIASLAAFCAKYDADQRPIFEAAKDDYPGFIAGPYCAVDDAPQRSEPAPARILEVRAVHLTSHDTKDTELALRTRRGWFLAGITVESEELRNPGCAGGCKYEPADVRISGATKNAPLVVTLTEECWSNPWPSGPDEQEIPGQRTFAQRATVCHVDGDGTPSCVDYTIGTAARPYLPMDFDGKWSNEKKEKVLPSGELVFE